MTSIIDEGLYRWLWYDFFNHFFLGGGEAIILWQVGHLQDVIDASKEHVFKGVERQVFRDARSVENGRFDDTCHAGKSEGNMRHWQPLFST